MAQGHEGRVVHSDGTFAEGSAPTRPLHGRREPGTPAEGHGRLLGLFAVVAGAAVDAHLQTR